MDDLLPMQACNLLCMYQMKYYFYEIELLDNSNIIPVTSLYKQIDIHMQLKMSPKVEAPNMTTRHMYNQQSDWDSIEHVISQSLVTASLRDKYTGGGGYFVFRVRRDKVEVVKDRNFLESCYEHSHIFCGTSALQLAFSDSLDYKFMTTLLKQISGMKIKKTIHPHNCPSTQYATAPGIESKEEE